MSAITGILHVNKATIPEAHAYHLMESLRHYPADDIHTWKKDGIFLGCHAQWITPESINEKLPYYDAERQLVITADAIIDNRDELCESLQIDKGLQKIMPDSRLILLAYARWGEDVARYLQGDFAFMIWDEKEQTLFGARDFSGARTLYFYRDTGRFVFSTTMAPLFTLPYIEKQPNEDWLAEFLAIPTVVEAVDMSSTVYASIQQLPPAHCLSVKEGKLSLQRYSTIEVNEKLKLKTNGEYEEAFRHVWQKAVKQRLRTHGEVGSHLSGGLDSGSVASFAAGMLAAENKPLNTFSYIPEETFTDWTPRYYEANETRSIQETVNHVGNISDHYMSFPGRSSLSEVDDFLNLMEMPYKFFENTFWLKGINEMARTKGIKVMLNGARGNHSISWGSMKLTHNFYAELMRKMKWIRLFNELDAYCKNFRTGKSVMVPFIAKRALPKIPIKKNKHSFPLLINPSFAEQTKVFEKLKAYGFDRNGPVIHNLTDYRRHYYNQLFAWNKSGVASTNLSLRYSVWDRDSTNDVNVIRFCLSLPEEQYTTDGMERSLIRRAMKDYLPDKVRLNQSTRGIQGADIVHRMAPEWKSFIDELHEMTNDSQMQALINIPMVKDALSKIGNEPKPDLMFTDEFRILTRSLILRRFLDHI